jgi:hypothetical protein
MARIQIKKAKPKWMPAIVAEMLGRNDNQDSLFAKITSKFSFYSKNQGLTIDKSQCDYYLMRSVYDASPSTYNNKTYGEELYLGAVFAKPIVNALAGFVLGDVPSIAFDAENKTETIENGENKVNKFLQENRDLLFDWGRNGFKEADGYVIFEEDGSVRTLAPECVTKVVDNKTGKLNGYDLTFKVKEENAKKQTEDVIYKKEIRPTYEEDFRIVRDKEESIDKKTFEKERPLRVVPFHNEPDPMAIYGKSELQSSLHLFIKYHDVLSSLIDNVIYNSTPVPVFEGLEEIDDFLENNFELDEKTNDYKLNWDRDKMMILGKGGSAKLLQATGVADDAVKTLNVIFWCICQTSETPEFVFGTAVASSNASVDSQMPIVIKKAKRKQAQFVKPLREFIDYYIWYMANIENDKDIAALKDLDYAIDFNPIVDSDMKLNLEVAKTLVDLGIIQKETAAKLCKIDDIVPDLKDEIDKATEEFENATQSAGIYDLGASGGSPDRDNNSRNGKKATDKVEEEIEI